MDKNAQRAVIFLDSFPHLEYKYKTAILNEIGDPKNLYARLPEFRELLHRAVGEEAQEILRLANPKGEAQVLENLQKRGIMPITRGNKYYPENLENTPAPPWVLYAMGNIELLKNRKFAIVGSRKTPQAELRLTEEFAEKIANRMTVVTGVAEGADAAAIRGALRKNNVISVLAYGFDYVYPEMHRALLSEVKEKGLLITEYPPSVPAYKWQFPVRNRVIAGLSEGVLVVSAREKSGALYTASYAATYGRDVFAFPYKVGEAAGKGCNALIKQGAALCDKAEEILQGYGYETEEVSPDLPFTDEEILVLRLLREEEGSIDDLAERSGLAPYALLAALNSLEICGHILKTGADGYRAVK